MASRAFLELVAAAVGIDPSTVANDSVLENKVIFSLKNASAVTGTAWDGTLTSDATAPDNDDTVTIGDHVYTFKTTLTGAANEVLIGASAAAALDNLKSAINKSAGEGTTYGYGTQANKWVTAGTNADTTQAVTAREKHWGASVATTETSGHLAWGAATLAGGAPNIVAVPAAAKQAVAGGNYV